MAEEKRRTTRFVGGKSNKDKLMERMAAEHGGTVPKSGRQSDTSKLADAVTGLRNHRGVSERSDRPTASSGKGSSAFDRLFSNIKSIVAAGSPRPGERPYGHGAVTGSSGGEVDAGTIGAAVDWLRFDDPNLADYMSPYDDAERAANESYAAGKNVISGTYQDLSLIHI